jgi:hypothetical protein
MNPHESWGMTWGWRIGTRFLGDASFKGIWGLKIKLEVIAYGTPPAPMVQDSVKVQEPRLQGPLGGARNPHGTLCRRTCSSENNRSYYWVWLNTQGHEHCECFRFCSKKSSALNIQTHQTWLFGWVPPLCFICFVYVFLFYEIWDMRESHRQLEMSR